MSGLRGGLELRLELGELRQGRGMFPAEESVGGRDVVIGVGGRVGRSRRGSGMRRRPSLDSSRGACRAIDLV
jgi:hypothetical protein